MPAATALHAAVATIALTAADITIDVCIVAARHLFRTLVREDVCNDLLGSDYTSTERYRAIPALQNPLDQFFRYAFSTSAYNTTHPAFTALRLPPPFVYNLSVQK